MPRETADLIALILTLVVAVVVVLTAITLLWLELTMPEQDTTGAVDIVSRIVGVLVAALVGYMAGRRTVSGGTSG
jgi:hypothetical protein